MKVTKQKKRKKSADDHMADFRRERQLRAETSKSRDLAHRIAELEVQLKAVEMLGTKVNHYAIPQPKSGKGSRAVAVAIASDWHIEEIVESEQVNGLNEFNNLICNKRVGRFFRHVLKLVKLCQQGSEINTLILGLLGDFISNGIHEELMESNRLLPIDALLECKLHLTSGIQYLLDNSELKLVIPCASGNHGRLTKKNRIATEAGNSLERFMYHSIAREFDKNPRVTFLINEGYHTYIKVWPNYTIRFHHGHQIKFYGGVGGLSIPMNKAIAQWNKARHVELDVVGHFHQFLDGGNWIVNGSLVGYNAFALSIKASPEPPRQAFFLVDSSVGKTIVAPVILIEDR